MAAAADGRAENRPGFRGAAHPWGQTPQWQNPVSRLTTYWGPSERSWRSLETPQQRLATRLRPPAALVSTSACRVPGGCHQLRSRQPETQAACAHWCRPAATASSWRRSLRVPTPTRHPCPPMLCSSNSQRTGGQLGGVGLYRVGCCCAAGRCRLFGAARSPRHVTSSAEGCGRRRQVACAGDWRG